MAGRPDGRQARMAGEVRRLAGQRVGWPAGCLASRVSAPERASVSRLVPSPAASPRRGPVEGPRALSCPPPGRSRGYMAACHFRRHATAVSGNLSQGMEEGMERGPERCGVSPTPGGAGASTEPTGARKTPGSPRKEQHLARQAHARNLRPCLSDRPAWEPVARFRTRVCASALSPPPGQ